jgi:Mg-chelatase subunit ChlD
MGRSSQANDTTRFAFIPGGAQPNAVRVNGRRTNGSAAGAVELLFSGVLGVREFEPRDSATSTLLDRDICLVVDRSGSMMESLDGHSLPGASCSPPHALSRWMALSAAVDGFLVELGKTRQQEHVALVSYSSDTSECGRSYRISETHVNLVFDYQLIRNAMAYISSAPVQGRTSISSGIDEGTRVLTGPSTRRFAVKTMVVLTDGLHNLGREPILSAQEAAAHGIMIHTITFSSDADIPRMQAVAAATGGQHFHAPSAEELVRIFKQIANTLPVMLTE